MLMMVGTARRPRSATTAVILGAALVLSGCGKLADRSSATFRAADAAGVHISNSPLIEHYEDMNQSNLLLAAASRGLDVMSVDERVPPSDSIYEWNEIVLRFITETSGFAPHEVIECWRYVFEGRFLDSGPNKVTCPANPPIEISVPPTVPPSTFSPQVVDEFEALRDQLSVALDRIDIRELDSAQLQSLTTEALAKFETDSVEAAVIDHIAAVAVRYRGVCLFARTVAWVEVWQPLVGNEEGCTASKAAEGGP